MRKAKPGPRSLAAIAAILGAEGFTEHCANEVKRYWMRRVVSDRQKGRLDRIKVAFSKMVAEKLDERDCLILGKFIAMQEAAQFQTGLRIGLMTLVKELDKQ